MESSRWAEQEFGRAELGDERRTRRLQQLGTAMAEHASSSLPEVCEDWAEQKAGYRFFSNEGVRPEAILASHRAATVERMALEAVVLAIQDTTTLDYSEHRAMIGLGALKSAKQRGMLVHTTLAVTPERVPLGLLDQQVWTRPAATLGKRASRKDRPIAEKESQKWLTSLQAASEAQAHCVATRVVSVGDREADVYDLFLVDRPAGVDLLVRAAWDRRVAAEHAHLWETLAAAPVLTTRTVEAPRQPGQLARTATVEIHAREVTLRPPKHRDDEHLPPVSVTAVWVIEPNPPPETEPLAWMLLTTLPVTTPAQAHEVVDWYCCRWEIEVWHKVLKSGCKIEERQLETAQRLHRCLALTSVVAWRLLFATRLARADPDLPCTVLLATHEWQALACRLLRTPTPPAEPPSLQQAVRWIAQLGGFPARASDGDPGPTTLWRGFLRLAELSALFRILSNNDHCPSCGYR
jgi:hypothetical protein